MTYSVKYKALLSFALLAVNFSYSCFAKSPTVFLVTEHLPPYQVVSDDLKVSGFATDIVTETFKRSQLTVKHNSFTWARSYNLALQKPNTCIYSIARIPSREHLFTWIGKLTEINNAVVWGLRNENHPPITELSELKNYKIAVNRNDVTHLGLLDRGFIDGEDLYVLDNTKSLIQFLVARPEIDFIVADDITIGYRAELAGVNFDTLQRIFEIKDLPLDFHLACSKSTHDKVINALTKALASIHQDGTYAAILARWQNKMIHQQ